MKKTKRLAAIVAVLLLVVAAIPSPMHAESFATSGLSAQAESWYYSVMPGDEEWATLDPWEAYEVCNMPENLLSVCSTERLAELVVAYPFAVDIWLFDNSDWGFEYLYNKSNIYREFLSREDAFESLLNKYGEIAVDYNVLNSAKSESNRPVLIASGAAQEAFVQTFFAANFTQLTTAQVSKLRTILAEKIETNNKNVGSAFMCSELKSKLGYMQEPNTNGSEGAGSSANSRDGFVVTNYYSFPRQACGESTTVNYAVGTYTKYGRVSQNALKFQSGDFSASQKNNINQLYTSTHPNLTYISSATGAYNCHSYAWISESSSNIYWIDSPENFYTQNSSYVTYKGRNVSAAANDRITFLSSQTLTHSAVVYSAGTQPASIMVRAKMGSAGVYSGSLSAMLAIYGTAYEVYDITP